MIQRFNSGFLFYSLFITQISVNTGKKMTHCHQIIFFKLLKCRCADAVCDNASPTRNASSWEMPTLVDALPSRNASAQEMPASADAVFMTMLRHSETSRQCRCFAFAKCFLLGNADTLRCFAFAKCFLAGNAGISRCCLNDNASHKRNVCNVLYNKNKYLFFGIPFKTNTVCNPFQAS